MYKLNSSELRKKKIEEKEIIATTREGGYWEGGGRLQGSFLQSFSQW